MINRTASTQYNDWTGGAAFDDADTQVLCDYAMNNGLIAQGDVIFSFNASYIHITEMMTVDIFYTNMTYDQFKNSGSQLSKSNFDITPAEFFKLFKRANFAVARKGL